ncbi:hypothetical protein BDN72DRAFT_892129 [Pluteus cervinus]|uniref:Uncharacterized protein n=1 Tax=Pluteus cervinus TaxID=181527 RepID=A0ACD3BF29_9AGAR|nr:hypothetical protein BDN72DRAFT_892129 [Pluteus cervinus]
MPILQFGPSPLLNQNEDLSSYFNRSASAVQVYADKFERQYARPALRVSQAFFDEHPVPATFIAIFSILSFLPVLTFIGLSALVLFVVTITGFVSSLCTSAVFILAFFVFLFFTLLVIMCISGLFTALAVGGYTLLRLATLVRHDGREGVAEWAQETKGHLSHAKTRIMRGMPLRQRVKQQRHVQPQRQAQLESQWSPSKQNQHSSQASGSVHETGGQQHELGWEEEDPVPGGLSGKTDTSEGEGSSGSVVVVKKEEEESSPSAQTKEENQPANGQHVEPNGVEVEHTLSKEKEQGDVKVKE